MTTRTITSPISTTTAIALFALVVLLGSSVVAQSADPRLAIRSARDIGVNLAPYNTDAVGSGQAVNSWDDRFGHGKPAAINGWGSIVEHDDRGNIYLGGAFTTAGSIANANYIGYWDGENWKNVGNGLNGPVSSISIIDGEVYVGGQFTIAGALPASQNLVKWNGSKWISIGNGLPGLVTDVEKYNDELYVSGWFSNAGSNGASFVARWDGQNWQPLAQGVNGWVSSMTVFKGKLIIAGLFTNASGVADTKYIAAWDGSKWTSLGTGANDLLLTVTTDGNNLYAGGAFTSVSNVAGTAYIAKWDGSKWSSLGNGVNDWVSSIHVEDDDLVAGGWFKTAINTNGQQILVNRLAKFNTGNSQWSSIGNGVSYSVEKETVALSVAQIKGNVYVAGVFNMTGSTPSIGFGRWIDQTVQAFETPKVVSPANNAIVYGNSATLKWDSIDGALTYTLQISTDSTFENDVKSVVTYKTDYNFSNVTPSVDYYWRVRTDFVYISSNWSATYNFMRGVATSLDEDALKPGDFRLLQNYPNPFNPGTTIGFELSESTQVTITIHSVDGRLVATLVNDLKSAGTHQVAFNAHNLSSGVYLYRMQTQKNVITRTMTLIK